MNCRGNPRPAARVPGPVRRAGRGDLRSGTSARPPHVARSAGEIIGGFATTRPGALTSQVGRRVTKIAVPGKISAAQRRPLPRGAGEPVRPLRFQHVQQHQAGADDLPDPVAHCPMVLDVGGHPRLSTSTYGARSKYDWIAVSPAGPGSSGTPSASDGSPRTPSDRRGAAPWPPHASPPRSPPRREPHRTPRTPGRNCRPGRAARRRRPAPAAPVFRCDRRRPWRARASPRRRRRRRRRPLAAPGSGHTAPIRSRPRGCADPRRHPAAGRRLRGDSPGTTPGRASPRNSAVLGVVGVGVGIPPAPVRGPRHGLVGAAPARPGGPDRRVVRHSRVRHSRAGLPRVRTTGPNGSATTSAAPCPGCVVTPTSSHPNSCHFVAPDQQRGLPVRVVMP